MRPVWSLALVVAALPIISKADSAYYFYTGNELYNLCSSRNYTDRWSCMMYAVDVLDSENSEERAISSIDGRKLFNGTPSVCFPSDKITTNDIADVVTKYLRDNPDKRWWPAPGLVSNAAHDAWPCPSTPPA
jgi:hypothetical protein